MNANEAKAIALKVKQDKENAEFDGFIKKIKAFAANGHTSYKIGWHITETLAQKFENEGFRVKKDKFYDSGDGGWGGGWDFFTTISW